MNSHNPIDTSHTPVADEFPFYLPTAAPPAGETHPFASPDGFPSGASQFSPQTEPVPRPATTKVWGTDFARVTMEDTIQLADRIIQARVPEYFITANLNYLMLTWQHPRLPEINANCACMIADGHPIVVRSRIESDPLPCRVAGSDMIVELAKLSADKGYRIFFLGAAPGVAQAAADELRARFPKLQIAGSYSPPFRPLTSAEHEEMLQGIRSSQPDILLVAFGQPKGEQWIYDNLKELQIPLCIQLGASFDFLAGTAKRAPAIWQRLGCEWLYRACSDPKRLIPRYGMNLLFLAKLLAGDGYSVGQRFWRRLASHPTVEALKKNFED